MADGDLAFSHVSLDNGALIYQRDGDALAYCFTRTYWNCTLTLSVSLDSQYSQYTQDVRNALNAWMPQRYFDAQNPPPANTTEVNWSGSGLVWHKNWLEVVYGSGPAYVEEYPYRLPRWNIRLNADVSHGINPLTNHELIAYIAPWGQTYGNYWASNGTLGPSLATFGGTVRLYPQQDGTTLIGNSTGVIPADNWPDEVQSASIHVVLEQENLGHNPLCNH